jgi:hypothetical protein
MEEGRFVAFDTEICDSGSSYNNYPAKFEHSHASKKQRPYYVALYRFASAEDSGSRQSTQPQIAGGTT